MKPDWDKLMDKYAGHANAFVGDVDCTSSGRSLCEEIGVKSYPTLKYGNPLEGLKDYKGGRDFGSMDAFAGTLQKPCGVKALHLCDEDTKKKIIEWQQMPPEELDALIKEKEDALTATETAFKEGVEKIQNRHHELQDEKEATIKAVKNGGLDLVKAVKNHLYPYKMSTLEKYYYMVASPVENLLATLGLLDQVQSMGRTVSRLLSKGKDAFGKATGVEL